MEWLAISHSRGSSWPRDQTFVSCEPCPGRGILYHWATWEAQGGELHAWKGGLGPTTVHPWAAWLSPLTSMLHLFTPVKAPPTRMWSEIRSRNWGHSGPRASLVPQTVKNLPAMWQTHILTPDWEDSLEKGTDRGAWGATVHGVAKSHEWATNTHFQVPRQRQEGPDTGRGLESHLVPGSLGQTNNHRHPGWRPGCSGERTRHCCTSSPRERETPTPTSR